MLFILTLLSNVVEAYPACSLKLAAINIKSSIFLSGFEDYLPDNASDYKCFNTDDTLVDLLLSILLSETAVFLQSLEDTDAAFSTEPGKKQKFIGENETSFSHDSDILGESCCSSTNVQEKPPLKSNTKMSSVSSNKIGIDPTLGVSSSNEVPVAEIVLGGYVALLIHAVAFTDLEAGKVSIQKSAGN